jgi:hypothetical protein
MLGVEALPPQAGNQAGNLGTAALIDDKKLARPTACHRYVPQTLGKDLTPHRGNHHGNVAGYLTLGSTYPG